MNNRDPISNKMKKKILNKAQNMKSKKKKKILKLKNKKIEFQNQSRNQTNKTEYYTIQQMKQMISRKIRKKSKLKKLMNMNKNKLSQNLK